MIIDRDVLRNIKADLAEALAEVGKQHGVLLQFGSGTFTETTATMKLEVALASGKRGESVRNVKAAEAWKKFHGSYGFKATWLGKEFTFGSGRYKILGLAPTRPKYPVLVLKNGGKEVLLTADVLRTAHKAGDLK